MRKIITKTKYSTIMKKNLIYSIMQYTHKLNMLEQHMVKVNGIF